MHKILNSAKPLKRKVIKRSAFVLPVSALQVRLYGRLFFVIELIHGFQPFAVNNNWIHSDIICDGCKIVDA
jgi:hypothetical protein